MSWRERERGRERLERLVVIRAFLTPEDVLTDLPALLLRDSHTGLAGDLLALLLGLSHTFLPAVRQ